MRSTVIALILCASCGVDPSPNDDSISGFSVTAETTHFSYGRVDTDTSASGVRRTTGENGVFVYFLASHGSLAVPNSGALDESFQGDSVDHELLIHNYYAGLGFPFDQLDTVTSFKTSGSGKVHYSTVFARRVQEIPVASSKISASCIDSKRCADEFVFWPSIPQSVVGEAKNFKLFLMGGGGSAYLASLPNGGKGGDVAIHHSSLTAAVVTFAVSFDLVDNGTPRSYSRGGAEVPWM
ncbi:hypothetical protein BH09MYX1_BH09MYX1_40990 [soil metagenome]